MMYVNKNTLRISTMLFNNRWCTVTRDGRNFVLFGKSFISISTWIAARRAIFSFDRFLIVIKYKKIVSYIIRWGSFTRVCIEVIFPPSSNIKVLFFFPPWKHQTYFSITSNHCTVININNVFNLDGFFFIDPPFHNGLGSIFTCFHFVLY